MQEHHETVKDALSSSPRDPGAQGTLHVEVIEGETRLVTVELEHLAPPQRISERATMYVVWFRDAENRSTMASVLEYDEDDRVGSARATTPRTEFTVVVSAEQDTNVAEPSEVIIFSQDVIAH